MSLWQSPASRGSCVTSESKPQRSRGLNTVHWGHSLIPLHVGAFTSVHRRLELQLENSPLALCCCLWVKSPGWHTGNGRTVTAVYQQRGRVLCFKKRYTRAHIKQMQQNTHDLIDGRKPCNSSTIKLLVLLSWWKNSKPSLWWFDHHYGPMALQ